MLDILLYLVFTCVCFVLFELFASYILLTSAACAPFRASCFYYLILFISRFILIGLAIINLFITIKNILFKIE